MRVWGSTPKPMAVLGSTAIRTAARIRSFAPPVRTGFALGETQCPVPKMRCASSHRTAKSATQRPSAHPQQWLRKRRRRLTLQRTAKARNAAVCSRRCTFAIGESRHDQAPCSGSAAAKRNCEDAVGRCVAILGSPAVQKLRFGPVALRPRLASGVLLASPRRLPSEGFWIVCVSLRPCSAAAIPLL